MRITAALIGAAALGFAQAAFAAPVTVAPISFSEDFQTRLDEDFGAREGGVLQRAVTSAVSDALAERGASISESAPVIVEISILRAEPNRPTFQQLVDTPGLDSSSISIGGATLHAVLRGADGQVLSEVDHRRYNYSLEDLTVAATTWSEARLAIRQFAEKVADAYVAHAR